MSFDKRTNVHDRLLIVFMLFYRIITAQKELNAENVIIDYFCSRNNLITIVNNFEAHKKKISFRF